MGRDTAMWLEHRFIIGSWYDILKPANEVSQRSDGRLPNKHLPYGRGLPRSQHLDKKIGKSGKTISGYGPVIGRS